MACLLFLVSVLSDYFVKSWEQYPSMPLLLLLKSDVNHWMRGKLTLIHSKADTVVVWKRVFNIHRKKNNPDDASPTSFLLYLRNTDWSTTAFHNSYQYLKCCVIYKNTRPWLKAIIIIVIIVIMGDSQPPVNDVYVAFLITSICSCHKDEENEANSKILCRSYHVLLSTWAWERKQWWLRNLPGQVTVEGLSAFCTWHLSAGDLGRALWT